MLTPRFLSVLALLAAVVGVTSAVVVLPSIGLFLTGEPSMADLRAEPVAIVGLLLVAPLLLIVAPLAFAFMVRRRYRSASLLGIAWWALVIVLTLAATLPVLGQAEPISLLAPLAIIVASATFITYFLRLRVTFGLSPAAAQATLFPLPSGQDAVVVRAYPGLTQADAAALFETDARALATRDYRPGAQSWADGRPGLGRILTLGLFANSLRPDGTLTVTYHLVTHENARSGPSRTARRAKGREKRLRR